MKGTSSVLHPKEKKKKKQDVTKSVGSEKVLET